MKLLLICPSQRSVPPPNCQVGDRSLLRTSRCDVGTVTMKMTFCLSSGYQGGKDHRAEGRGPGVPTSWLCPLIVPLTGPRPQVSLSINPQLLPSHGSGNSAAWRLPVAPCPLVPKDQPSHCGHSHSLKTCYSSPLKSSRISHCAQN